MFLHLPVFLPLQVPFFHCVLCSLRLDLEYTCTLNRVTFISSMSDCWEQELQQCLEADLDFAPGDLCLWCVRGTLSGLCLWCVRGLWCVPGTLSGLCLWCVPGTLSGLCLWCVPGTLAACACGVFLAPPVDPLSACACGVLRFAMDDD